MEVLQIGIPKWNITELSGYEPITTFWQDFSIADKLGINDIEETYECIKSEWKDDFKYWTELCLVLNHKIWQWYESCLLYTSPSPRDRTRSRMPSSA